MFYGRDEDDGARRRRKPRPDSNNEEGAARRQRKPRRVSDNNDGPKAKVKYNAGQIKKGEVRNPWGPLGNPERRAAREAANDASLSTLFARELQRSLTIMEGGRKITMSYRELIVKKLVRDLMEVPAKARLALLGARHSIYRDLLNRLEPEEEEGWTPELEREFRIVEERYNLPAKHQEEDRAEEAFLAWHHDQRHRRGSPFDMLSREEQVREFLKGRDPGPGDDEHDLGAGMMDN